MSEAPNPGSLEAIAQGCKCPRIDNHNGRGVPHPDGPQFWVSELCEMHAPKEDKP